MDPRKEKPGILRPNMTGNVPLIGGMQQLQVMISQLCVNCFPKPKPAVFIWFGNSLCQECFVPRRKQVDSDEKDLDWATGGIDVRDYKETWGEEPKEEEGE